MASMGSFPGGLDIPVLLNSASYRKPMNPLLAYKARKCVEVADRCRVEVPRSSRKEFCNRFALLNGFSTTRRRGGRKQCINATGEGSGGGETGEGSVDPLQATIEKGEKVLEIQRGLLQQIAERKKLVSSIKSSIIDLESNEPPSLVSDVPAPRIGAAADTRATPGKTFPGNGASFDVSPQEQLKTTTSWDARSTGVSSWSPKSFPAPSPKPSFETSINEDSNKYTKDKSFSSVILSDMPLSTEDEKYKQSEETNPRDVNADVQEPAKEDVKPPPLAGANVMNIILVAAECSPWIKTGGLGDVVGALPKALARRGHRVMVVVPRYREYAEAQDLGVKKIYKVQNQDMEVTYFHTYIDGVDFVFINSPEFRNTGTDIYGGNRMDILRRIVLFCKAAVEVPWHVPCGGICYGDGNLVFIANDWHTALLPVYLKAYYRDNGLMKYTRSVLVIHNIAHQGRGPVDDFRYVDLPPHYLDHFKLYDPVGGDHFNIFAAGLKTADRIVTVSHGYAWELKTVEGGWGLQGIINENDWKLRGIVNGIDTKDWSPECDIYLQSDGYVNYSPDTLKTGKAQCKAALQKELHLPVRDDIPLIGFVGRLDHQKGVDLIAEAVPWMMSQGVQLAMLGTGRDDLEEMLLSFEAQYKDKVKGWVGFSVKTAHRITAGADILLMPSRFEPCGLNQMYAMHYGTIPVVHSVGGLRDTVVPFNPYEETGFGWTFPTADAHELIDALRNCLLTYREYKQSWEGLQRRGMVQDLSWDNAALNYEEVLVAAKYQW